MNKISVMIAASIAIATSLGASAAHTFPGASIKPGAVVRSQDRFVTDTATGSKMTQTSPEAKSIAERDPVSLRLGARSHLFDGYFLCDLPERPAVLAQFQSH